MIPDDTDLTAYIVSVRPAPGRAGPTLVSDDPSVVRAVLDAIQRTYTGRPARMLHIDRAEPDGAA